MNRCKRCGHDAHHAEVTCSGTFVTDGLAENCICADCRCDACDMGPKGVAPESDTGPEREV